MHSARQKLLSTLAYKSFRLGEFKLSSGGTSDYYIDCRTTTLDAKGSRLTGEVFLEEIGRRGWIRHRLRAFTQPGKMEVHDSLCLQGSARRSFALRRRDLRQGGESLRDDVLRRRK